MEQICNDCWNTGCKQNEDLRKSKFEVCKDMEEHPEHWEENKAME